MKNLPVLVMLLAFASPVTVVAQGSGPAGDITFWIPFKAGVSQKDAQVSRNKEYVSIKLHSVFAYYKSGFLENIKQLIVASDIAFEREGKLVEGTMVNKSWQKLDSSGDFIALNDHLAVLAPATPPSVRLKISFRGVGEDKFKKVFDVLSSADLKTALTLSDATIGKVGAFTSIARKFLATPYTSDNQRQILDVEQSFVLYPADAAPMVDALREGYLVVVSARGGKTEDLSRVHQLTQEDIRLSALGQGLEFRDTDNSWKPFTRVSYVIVSVTKTPVRDNDEGSAWFRKYGEAVSAAEKVQDGSDAVKAKEEAVGLLREGNALLQVDPNYIEDERRKIRSQAAKQVNEALTRSFATAYGKAPWPSLLKLDAPDIPSNYADIAAEYKRERDGQKGNLVVQAFPEAEVVLIDAHNPTMQLRTTANEQGNAIFPDVRAGQYKLTANMKGLSSFSSGLLVIDPKETKTVSVGQGVALVEKPPQKKY